MEKAEGKCRSGMEPARHGNRSSMKFHDSLCQGKPQSNALCILRKAAAVKSLENVIQIFRANPRPIVLYHDFCNNSALLPGNVDAAA
jgi:hypothetical protein